jgi:2-C-methyl-D-erythritol 4-phosphate cytidylyltransferase
MAPLGGRPVLAHALRAFAGHPAVAALVVVAAGERLEAVRRLAAAEAGSKPTAVVAGGERRQDSVLAGVEALPDCAVVAIHDGARPFVTAAMIDAGLAALGAAPAAIAVAPVVDTIKRVDAAGRVIETPARASLRAAQTPQFFRLTTLRAAYARADWAREYTDEAGLVEVLGEPVATFAGDPRNIKITTPHDLIVAEAIWRAGRGGEA